MNPSAGETPEQIGIDRAEREFAARGFIGGAGNVGQKPSELCAGEIRIEQKPGLRRDERFVTAVFQTHAQIGGAPVLPDDGAMHRAAGVAVPQ